MTTLRKLLGRAGHVLLAVTMTMLLLPLALFTLALAMTSGALWMLHYRFPSASRSSRSVPPGTGAVGFRSKVGRRRPVLIEGRYRVVKD